MSQTDQNPWPQSSQAAGKRRHLSPFVRYMLWAGISFMVLVLMAEWMITGNLLLTLIAMLGLGVAILVPMLYRSTVKHIRSLHAFQEQGRIYRLVSRRTFRVTWWCLYCLVVSLFTLVELHTYHLLEWLLFMATIPVFYAVYRRSHVFVRREMRPYLVTTVALTWACRLCPVVMVLLYAAVFALYGDIPEYDSFQAAVTAQKQVVADLGQSALVWEIGQFLAFLHGAKMYVLSSGFSVSSIIPWVLFFLGTLMIFFNACSILSGFLIPSKEYLRIFAPLSDAPSPGPVSKMTIAMTSGIISFLILFLLLPIIGYVDTQLAQFPVVSEARRDFERATIKYVDVIGDEFYQQGTLQEIQQARMQALYKAKMSSTRVQSLLDRYFDQMEGNVDAYLDWYYSLVGEYSRIFNMLIGEICGYMQEKLVQYLQKGAKVQEINHKMEQALAQHQQVMEEYDQTREQILAQRKIKKPQGAYKVAEESSLEVTMAPLSQEDAIPFSTRMGASGAATLVVSSLVVKKVLTKKSVKIAIKTGAKKLAKVVASKAASSAGGTAVGATVGGTIGSFIPGPGTALGAAIGGVAGAMLAGISVDAMLLQLEEIVSREEFKAKLVQAIEQTRQEMKRNLSVSGNEVLDLSSLRAYTQGRRDA